METATRDSDTNGVIPPSEKKNEVDERLVHRGVRAVRVERRDLEAFGYTKGCRTCEIIRSGVVAHDTSGHAPECHRRVVGKMRTEGAAQQKRRVHEAERRQNEDLAKKLEGEDKRQQHARAEASNARTPTEEDGNDGPSASSTDGPSAWTKVIMEEPRRSEKRGNEYDEQNEG